MRLITGISLVMLSLEAVRSVGLVRWLATAEIAAAAAFCLPVVWRAGAVTLLAILGIALIHHAIVGHFAAVPLFAGLIVLLELTHERP
ncbi:MAG: hypothetical protein E6H48_14870 [Betaproteobacteria bacterium]|nr:MAG: hypothetical protein E6H48_14870 [Betaproteobacteria bacterium]